jgi:RNA-directed DNA polymerase
MMNIEAKKYKVHSLTGRIDANLMIKAWKAVRRNRGAPGIDGVTIESYGKRTDAPLSLLMAKLKTRGSYKSAPLKRVFIPKGKTKKLRPLGIPNIDDRIAQTVIRELIEPIFERQFHENSFGFRPGRNCHQAVEQVLRYQSDGYRYTVDVDIKGFFDNIDHDLIMTFLRAEIADGNILDIIETFLRSGVVENRKLEATDRGTPQGGSISPLLANIVLNHLDWELDSAGYKFVRYADDFVIMCKTQSEAESALNFALEVLKQLKLENSPEKTKISTPAQSFQFLGFEIKRSTVVIREKSREKLEDSLRDATIRSHNLEEKVFEKLNRIIRGTVNYFCTSFSHTLRYFERLERWVRRRLRSMKYKTICRTNNMKLKNKILAKRGLQDIRQLCQDAKERYRCSLAGKHSGTAH